MTESMATVKCPHCYSVIDARAKVCPHCGKNARTKTIAYQVGSFIMALCLLVAIAGLFVEPSVILIAFFVFIIGWVIRRQA